MKFSAPNARIQARLQQKQIDERRRAMHKHVALLLRDRRQSAAVVAYAKAEVQKWRAGHLCSESYIKAWSQLLVEPERAADVLESDSPSAVSMRQNTPFAAYLR